MNQITDINYSRTNCSQIIMKPAENLYKLVCASSPYGTWAKSIDTFFIDACARHTIPQTRICVKLDYISSLMPQTACLGKICGPRYLGPKLAKSAIFGNFFSFSNITFEILILEEKFWPHKCRAHQSASFHVFGMSLR